MAFWYFNGKIARTIEWPVNQNRNDGKMTNQRKDTPSTITQLASAMAALGMYGGENSEAEHKAEAKRLGGEDAYRRLLVNALLGTVETEALLADSEGAPDEHVRSAHRQARISAGVEDDPKKLLELLRWQTLRIEGPLREIVQNEGIGPIPLAAAHTAEGLQLLLGICAQGQDLEHASPDRLTSDLKGARESLTTAIKNIDVLLSLITEY